MPALLAPTVALAVVAAEIMDLVEEQDLVMQVEMQRLRRPQQMVGVMMVALEVVLMAILDVLVAAVVLVH